MADLVTRFRRALGLERPPPEAEFHSEHDHEHDEIDRRLDRNDVRLRALDARIKAQTARRR